jgi:hypothetical protein
MAAVLDKKTSIDWDSHTSRARFPWDEWTNGEVYQGIQGEDFQCGPHAFTAQLRARAEKLGVKVKTRVEKGTEGEAGSSVVASVFFQFGAKK